MCASFPTLETDASAGGFALGLKIREGATNIDLDRRGMQCNLTCKSSFQKCYKFYIVEKGTVNVQYSMFK